MNGFDLEPHWIWLLGAIALGIAEPIVPGVFLIWLAAAAAHRPLTLAFGSHSFHFAVFACRHRRRLFGPALVPSPTHAERRPDAQRPSARSSAEPWWTQLSNAKGRVRFAKESVLRWAAARRGAGAEHRGDGICLKVEPVADRGAGARTHVVFRAW